MVSKVRSILLVEDEDAARFLAQEVVRRSGLADHFVALGNGREALEFLEKAFQNPEDNHIPDIILLDLYMPEMGGLEFLDAFNSKFRSRMNCAIFLLIHDKANSYMFRNWDSLLRGYVDKPLTVEKMKDIVNAGPG